MVTIHNFEQGSEEWRKIREGKYTGSTIHEFLKRKKKLEDVDKKYWGGNYYTRRGHALEKEAIELYERIKGIKVQHAGFVTNTDYPKCGVSPDGYTDDTVIEVKCFNETKHKAASQSLTLEIESQTRFNAMIMEKPIGVVLLYNPEVETKDALVIIELPEDTRINERFKQVVA